jgi:hypothetical protein
MKITDKMMGARSNDTGGAGKKYLNKRKRDSSAK